MYHWVISFIAIVLSHLAPCLFFWVRDESRLHDKTSWWLWRRLTRRSRKTVTEVLKMPLKVQGLGFSQCWPTKKIIFPFLFQITFTVINTDLFHVHILHSDCSRIQQTECSKKDYLYEYWWQLPFWLNFFQKLRFFFVGNKTRICKTIAITIGYYCCCIIFPLLHFIACTF